MPLPNPYATDAVLYTALICIQLKSLIWNDSATWVVNKYLLLFFYLEENKTLVEW